MTEYINNTIVAPGGCHSPRKSNNAMAFIPAPNTVKVSVIGTLDGQQIVNVWHVGCPSEPTALDLIAIRDLFIDWLRNDVLPLLANEFVYTLIELLSIHEENGIFLSGAITSPNQGSGGTGTMPNETAFCVSLHTNQSGRSFRGRKFFSGIPRANVTGNRVSNLYADNWQLAVNQLISDLQGANFILYVVSYVQNGVPLVTARVTEVVNAVYTDTVLDSQRPRKPGHGA